VWGPSLLLAATLASAPASAALVAAAEAGVVESMGTQAAPGTFFENLRWARPATALQAPHPLRTSAATEVNPIGGVFMAFLAQITSKAAHVATLHDFLVVEEPAALSLELTGAPAPRPRQAMIRGLLADLDLALHALQEGGDDEQFMASRETGPGTYLRVAQQSRPRSGLY
jgi:hypothetical protein